MSEFPANILRKETLFLKQHTRKQPDPQPPMTQREKTNERDSLPSPTPVPS